MTNVKSIVDSLIEMSRPRTPKVTPAPKTNHEEILRHHGYSRTGPLLPPGRGEVWHHSNEVHQVTINDLEASDADSDDKYVLGFRFFETGPRFGAYRTATSSEGLDKHLSEIHIARAPCRENE
jgi:hypothetical protein